MKGILVSVGIALAAVSAFAKDKPHADAKRGMASYTQYGCYTCHGTRGEGGGAAGPAIQANNGFPWDAFVMQVRNPRADMPAYRASQLSDRELADIYAYLQTIKLPRLADDIPLLRKR